MLQVRLIYSIFPWGSIDISMKLFNEWYIHRIVRHINESIASIIKVAGVTIPEFALKPGVILHHQDLVKKLATSYKQAQNSKDIGDPPGQYCTKIRHELCNYDDIFTKIREVWEQGLITNCQAIYALLDMSIQAEDLISKIIAEIYTRPGGPPNVAGLDKKGITMYRPDVERSNKDYFLHRRRMLDAWRTYYGCSIVEKASQEGDMVAEAKPYLDNPKKWDSMPPTTMKCSDGTLKGIIAAVKEALTKDNLGGLPVSRVGDASKTNNGGFAIKGLPVADPKAPTPEEMSTLKYIANVVKLALKPFGLTVNFPAAGTPNEIVPTYAPAIKSLVFDMNNLMV